MLLGDSAAQGHEVSHTCHDSEKASFHVLGDREVYCNGKCEKASVGTHWCSKAVNSSKPRNLSKYKVQIQLLA